MLVIMAIVGSFNYRMQIGINFYFTFNQKVVSMDFDTLHLQVPYLSECQLTCRLQQVHQDAEEEEEDFWQPIFGIGGSWRE